MKKFSLILLSALCLSILADGQRIKKSAAYLKTPGKVGILIVTITNTDKSASSGGLGLIGGVAGGLIAGARSTDKFDTVLTVIEPKVNPLDTAKGLYKAIYTQKGKTVAMIDKVDLDSFADFTAPKGTGKKYLGRNVMSLKEKYGIDDLVIIAVDYGIEVHYKYGIETYREGVSRILTTIVDLRDNSIVVHDTTPADERIFGKWNTPPDYEKVTSAIRSSIKRSLTNDLEKYTAVE